MFLQRSFITAHLSRCRAAACRFFGRNLGNYVPNSLAGGIFGDGGPPDWAKAARPDPDLAFTADGRAWVLFTGRADIQAPPAPARYRAGIVEVNVKTGKAIGQAAILFDPQDEADLPFMVASDLSLVSAPGQPDRIFGYTGNPLYPLAQLDLPQSNRPGTGQASQ